jgi:hypothetical protein
MDDHYAAGRDGVFSRPYEPGVLGLPREQQQQQRLGRLSSDSSAAGRGLRIKQELDLVPERVKMEPEDSLEYYYAAAGRALPLDSFAFRQQRRHASVSPPPPPPPPCLAYPPPPEDGFAAYAAATFRETEVSPAAAAARGRRLEQSSSPQHRLHRVSLTLHLKAEAREEAEREGGGRGEGGRGQRCPPPGQEEEEEEYKDRSEAGSSRTVIGGLSSICRTTHEAGGGS